MRSRPPGDRRRVATAITVGLAACGLGLIGVGLAGQESVPGLSAEARAMPATPVVVSAPAAGGSEASSAGPGSAHSSVSTPPGPVLPASSPVQLTVPSVGIDVSGLVPLGLRPDGALGVPQDEETVGWYRHAPTPGAVGPAVLAGHVDSAVSGPAVFFRLAEVRPGAEIRVGRSDGTTAVFTVERVAQYPKDRFPTTEVYGDTDHAALRLITCGGSFNRSAGSYRDNIVVFARLTDTG